ncbi:MAG: asparagine--tRNA ligase, partial [Chryseobacterium sp.]|nr:asparagine--tRNA ligase [Chryseobacterium sp.]
RFRTNLFGCVFRIRHAVSFAIHQYFNQNQFFYLNTPIITGADAEGAGEMFGVSNFDLNNLPKTEDGEIDYEQDFFGRKTNLTVSGQLEGETAAMGLGRIYTFGPTFRAENSNTTRHLAEFWMVEPEVAFNDLEDNIDLAEDFLKYVIQYVLDNCKDDLVFLDNRFAEEQKTKPEKDRAKEGLIEKLENVITKRFKRVSYTEAIEILLNSKENKKGKFQFPIENWGTDLQSEHERFLVEKHFESPVVLFDYPKDIKAFYMRVNDDGKTVAAMDVLFPGIGEIIGGAQREERYVVLKNRMQEMHVDENELWWYLDTRKFGSVPHSGFGLGLERLVLFVTGMTNIRDVIPFPRTPKNAEF